MAANPERGEVAIEINGEKGVLCAEMARLAILSDAIGTKSFRDLMERLNGIEPFAIFAAVDALVIEGDAKGIKDELKSPVELSIVSGAVIKSLSALMSDGKKSEGETGKRD